MAKIRVKITGTLKMFKAEMDLYCSCCQPPNKKREQVGEAKIKKDDTFYYLSAYRQYILVCNGQYMIPYQFQTPATRDMLYSDFRDPVKVGKICKACFSKLGKISFGDIVSPQEFDVEVSFETELPYYTYTMVSEQDYRCRCCREGIPKGSSYYRYGIYAVGAVCVECHYLLARIVCMPIRTRR